MLWFGKARFRPLLQLCREVWYFRIASGYALQWNGVKDDKGWRRCILHPVKLRSSTTAASIILELYFNIITTLIFSLVFWLYYYGIWTIYYFLICMVWLNKYVIWLCGFYKLIYLWLLLHFFVSILLCFALCGMICCCID